MTGKGKDGTAAEDTGDAADGPSEQQVADHLRNHPDFLVRHPDILETLAPPARWSGDGVVDMQRYLLDQMRGEMGDLRDCVQDVIETSRHNLSTQTRTHAAVLALLSANDLEQMVRIVAEDLPLLLDVDVVALGFERTPPGVAKLVSSHVQRFDEGFVDHLLGTDHDVVLRREMGDDGTVFGAGSGLVQSAALARVRRGAQAPVGLLALGSRGPSAFHPGQGTELITFLARVVERLVHRWLESPA